MSNMSGDEKELYLHHKVKESTINPLSTNSPSGFISVSKDYKVFKGLKKVPITLEFTSFIPLYICGRSGFFYPLTRGKSTFFNKHYFHIYLEKIYNREKIAFRIHSN